MGAKIDATIEAVKPHPSLICTAYIILRGHNLESIRSVFGRSTDRISDHQKGIIFLTPDTPLYNVAMREMAEKTVSQPLCNI